LREFVRIDAGDSTNLFVEAKMSSVLLSQDGVIATVILQRGKVNALNEPLVEELARTFQDLEEDENVKSVILTGRGKFFSFGFDIPEFLSYSKEDFVRYLEKFIDLYTLIFQFPKPIVAALNGHTIAGGCMLATACDYRLMVEGRSKISLNEITFGSSVFAGSVEILRFCVGQRNAEVILYGGLMYSAEEACQLGLVDRVSTEATLTGDAREVAQDFAQKDSSAFRSIKALLRKPLADAIRNRERESVLEFVEIWYSEKTWKNLEKIKIHS
jgi:enoyl-CoA hydratase/carnithine racemase